MWWKRVQQQAYSAYSRMKSFENKFLIKFSSQKKKKKKFLLHDRKKFVLFYFVLTQKYQLRNIYV